MSNGVTAECSQKPNNERKQNEINAWINKKYYEYLNLLLKQKFLEKIQIISFLNLLVNVALFYFKYSRCLYCDIFAVFTSDKFTGNITLILVILQYVVC